MNNINPIFEALNNVDDNVITKTLPKKKKVSLPIVFTSVAAAAVLFMTGFSTVRRSEARFGKLGTLTVDLDPYTPEGITIPTEEELIEMGAVPDEDCRPGSQYVVHALPSEVLEKFNLDIVNDNFTERIFEDRPNEDIMLGFYRSINDPQSVYFDYTLTDKNLNADVRFSLRCVNTYEGSLGFEFQGDVNHEMVTLNDGSKAIIYSYKMHEDIGVYEPRAIFSYNGIVYELNFWVNGPIRDFSFDDMKQVLSDLGVL